MSKPNAAHNDQNQFHYHFFFREGGYIFPEAQVACNKNIDNGCHSDGGTYFIPSVGPRKHFLTGWNSPVANSEAYTYLYVFKSSHFAKNKSCHMKGHEKMVTDYGVRS